MISEGDIVLFRFPQTDQSPGKLRPALLLRKSPGDYPDWLVCMISTRLDLEIRDFDLVVPSQDPNFAETGLKKDSLIRISRLAIVEEPIFEGKLGTLPTSKANLIRERLSSWLIGK